MANSVSHGSLPYPIKNARFSLLVPYLDADGDPTDPTTPDTEFSGDAGAFADCAEEVATISGSNGVGHITLSGAETNYSMLAVVAKVASGPKNTIATLYPRNLATVGSGTLSAGSAGGGTLGTLLAYDVTGCFIRTTGGTGGGGTGGANNQARRIVTYTVSTGAFTVTPNWETTPDATTTYDVLLPEGVSLGMLKALNPATAGRTLVVDANGLADATAVKVGPTGSGTAQTAGDIPARLPAALVSGRMDSSIGAVAAAAIGAAAFAASALDAVWSTATRLLTAGTNIALAKGTGVTGFTDLDASGVRSAVGLAAANLDTQLAAIAAYIDTEVAAIKAKTDNLPSDPADASDIAAALTAVQVAVLAKLPAALTSDGLMKSDTLRVGGTLQTAGDVAALIAALTLYASRTVIRGTVGATSPATTSFTPSALSPAGSAADQFKGRILVFDNDTTTVALRGQATDITASSAAALPLLTFTALTTAPASGDTFSVV